mgnify:CR=1 FL=1
MGLNKDFDQIKDYKSYWLNEEYKKSMMGKFFELELIEEVDSMWLSLDNLMKNGLKVSES